jgi:hypothetical protein
MREQAGVTDRERECIAGIERMSRGLERGGCTLACEACMMER